jgi:ribosome-binding protein aMBF1 (putative translation factor)
MVIQELYDAAKLVLEEHVLKDRARTKLAMERLAKAVIAVGDCMENDVPEDYAKQIKELCEKLGWLQEKLAGRIGVSRIRVSRWSRGMQRPDPISWVLIKELQNANP